MAWHRPRSRSIRAPPGPRWRGWSSSAVPWRREDEMADSDTLKMIAGFAATGTALDKICADKAVLVAERKKARSLASLEADARAASPARGFAKSLRAAVAAGRYGLIAEIKKA